MSIMRMEWMAHLQPTNQPIFKFNVITNNSEFYF